MTRYWQNGQPTVDMNRTAKEGPMPVPFWVWPQSADRSTGLSCYGRQGDLTLSCAAVVVFSTGT